MLDQSETRFDKNSVHLVEISILEDKYSIISLIRLCLQWNLKIFNMRKEKSKPVQQKFTISKRGKCQASQLRSSLSTATSFPDTFIKFDF